MTNLSNADAREMLSAFRSSILGIYPIKGPSDVDDRYALAMGLILGIVTEAIKAVEDNRPMNVHLKEGPPGDT